MYVQFSHKVHDCAAVDTALRSTTNYTTYTIVYSTLSSVPVARTDTVVDVGAVVIHDGDAAVTDATVLAAHRFDGATRVTEARQRVAALLPLVVVRHL